MTLLWPYQEVCTFPESAGNQAQVFRAAFRNVISPPQGAVGAAGLLGRVHGRNGRSTAKETQISRSSEKHNVDCVARKGGFTISTAFCVAVGSKLVLIIILVVFLFGDRHLSCFQSVPGITRGVAKRRFSLLGDALSLTLMLMLQQQTRSGPTLHFIWIGKQQGHEEGRNSGSKDAKT